MPDLVTRCPECGTLFNASAEQLETAGGLVRCGVCLAVFDGPEHRHVAPVSTGQPETGNSTTPGSFSPAWQAPTADAAGAEPVADPEPDGESSPIDDCNPPENPSPAWQDSTADAGAEGIPAQKSDGESLPIDDGSQSETLSPAWPRPPSLGAAHQFTLRQAPAADAAGAAGAAGIATPESDGASPPIDDDSPPENPSSAWQAPTADAAGTEGIADGEAESGAAADTDSDRVQAPVLADDIFAPPESSPPSRSGLLVWPGLTVLALLVLAGAYSWLNAGPLVDRFESWRPRLTLFCELTRCELPPRTDLSQLQIAGLVVRTHPQQAEKLLVEARLINRADFAQPLPTLNLSFEDLQGRPVAQHVFTASEYNSRDGTNPLMVDSHQQVAVRLAIDDPGPAAVSYLLTPRGH